MAETCDTAIGAETKESEAFRITTKKGLIYEKCRIQLVEPDGINITHSSGIAKIAFPDLHPDFAERFGYNPEKAAEYSREMAERRAELAEKQRLADEARALAAATELVYTNVICRSCGGRGYTVGLLGADGTHSKVRCLPCRGSGSVKQAVRQHKTADSDIPTTHEQEKLKASFDGKQAYRFKYYQSALACAQAWNRKHTGQADAPINQANKSGNIMSSFSGCCKVIVNPIEIGYWLVVPLNRDQQIPPYDIVDGHLLPY